MGLIYYAPVILVICLLCMPPIVMAEGTTKPVSRMAGRHFIQNIDCNDYDYYAPPGNAQVWMRERYRLMISSGADVLISDIALPDVVETINTPTGEIIGARLPDELRKGSKRYQTIMELSGQCTDTLRLACEEGHRGGALVLAGMRMSDAHHGEEWMPSSDVELFGKFIMDHPEWCNTWPDGRKDATLNYSVPEVQAHRLAILRELAMNYDIDGIELDWMRWCRHFPAGRQREYMASMTGFVCDVRKMLDEVAHIKGVDRMILGHRIAVTMEENLDMGCDIPTWMKDGYADYVSPMDFLFNDPNIRTDEYVQAAEGTGCLVYPTVTSKYSFGRMYDDNNLYEGKDNHRAIAMRTLDRVRALAHNFFTWGADGGSCFNMYMWDAEELSFYKQMTTILSNPKLSVQGPRHYIYLPIWKDHSGGVGPTKRFNAQSLSFGTDTVGKRQAFTFRMADGRKGEKLKGILRFRIYDANAVDAFKIDLNDKSIPVRAIKTQYQPNGEVFDEELGKNSLPVPKGNPFDHSVPFTWPANLRFEIDLSKCPPFKGDNELGITLMNTSIPGKTLVMEAVEIMVEGNR